MRGEQPDLEGNRGVGRARERGQQVGRAIIKEVRDEGT